jgi:ATP phosphoribosyltransferase
MPDKTLKLGIPKGSLQKATIELFNKAGFHITETERGYAPLIDDEQIQPIYLRAQEISRYVADDIIDAGITGYDWITENNSDVVKVCELMYSKTSNKPTRWVLAVSNESKVKKPQDLRNGLIATELVNVTKKYFTDKNIDVKVEFSWGATEGKTLLVGIDAIVELTETGSTLKENNLRIIDTVLTSMPWLIANKKAWQDSFKREKIENISILLSAAINAANRVGLKMNVRKDDLKKVLKLLPAEKSPTISSLADSDYVAVEVIIEDKVERSLVPTLKRAGASGIITYPLNKVIH